MYFGPQTNVRNSPWPESAGEVVQLLPGILVAPAQYHQDQPPLVEQPETIGWPGSNMFWEEQVIPHRQGYKPFPSAILHFTGTEGNYIDIYINN